jgi:hypothetical protein
MERKLNRGKARVRRPRHAIPAILPSNARSAQAAKIFVVFAALDDFLPLVNHAQEVNVDALNASAVPFIGRRWFASLMSESP